MKYFIIAGEQSADLHGAYLMQSILQQDPEAKFRYWGGAKMTAVSPGKLIDITESAIMGFAEVVKNIGRIRGFFSKTKGTISEFSPDVIVLIDYPGFNLRIARWAKQQGYKIAYYISPQLWAWKKGRKESIRQYVDELMVILPFEKEWYAKEGIAAHFVGHPLLEALAKYQYQPVKIGDKPLLALLPGSRKQEVSKMLPLMLAAAEKVANQYDIVVAATGHLNFELYHDCIGSTKAKIVTDRTYDILAASSMAVVTSGTATLETALHNVPQVVCYKTSAINYGIGKRLVDLEYISLVNLILDEAAVPELIQQQLTPDNIVAALQQLDNDRNIVQSKYQILHTLLSAGEPASKQVAKIVYNLSQQSK